MTTNPFHRTAISRRREIGVVGLAALLVLTVLVIGYGGRSVSADQSEGGRIDLTLDQRKITAGAATTCTLLDDGRVQCWGTNLLGEQGTDIVPVPLARRAVVGVSLATAVSAGASHACALIHDGSIRCWGLGGNGQLGNGSPGSGDPTTFRRSAVTVAGIDDATAIAAGGFHTCALHEGGAVSCWGHDGSGQLGDGPEDPLDPTGGTSTVPVQVVGLSDATAITAGEFHTCALRATGAVVCWGHNGFGQLGNGADLTDTTNDDRDIPVTVSGIPDADGREARALVAGYGHTCAIVDDDPADALANSRTLCWGDNTHGQIGDNTRTTRTTPAVVEIDIDPGPFPWEVDLEPMQGATSITAGQAHTCARIFGGTARCWGSAAKGQIGNGTTGDRFAPAPATEQDFDERKIWKTPQVVSGGGVTAITAGGFHTCALRGAALSCWGDNFYGQLGAYSNLNAKPEPVTALRGVIHVATGTNHACALTEGPGEPPPTEAVCWGSNAAGVLGAGFDPATFTDTMHAVDVAGLPEPDRLTAGNGHVCALPEGSGTPWCWGRNGHGQLGNATTTNASTPVVMSGLADATQISAHGALAGIEEGHTCARRSDGTAACWGRNFFGQLGDATTTDRSTPVTVKWDHDGDPMTGPVPLTGVISVATGGFHTCARMDGDGVKCWGHNGNGQLGTGTVGGFSSVAVTTVYDHDNDGGASTPPVPLDITSQVAAGRLHTCGVRTSGFYRCWGANHEGQLGDGTTVQRPLPVLVSGIPEPGDRRSVDITAGDNHTCGRLSNTSIRCWGDNSFGQLGTGSTSTHSATPVVPVGLDNDAADNAKSAVGHLTANVSAGRNNTCVSRIDKAAVCWGDNTSGQLGDGIGPQSLTGLPVAGLLGTVGTNIVPTPVDDELMTDPGVAVGFDVATNDIDLDGDTLTFAVTDAPDHGTLSGFSAATGTGTYTPDPGYCGPDSFTYTASDGVAASPAQVTIDITCPNAGPDAVDDAATTDEDTSVTVAVQANDSDAESDPLTVTAVGPATNGVTSTNGITVEYVPNPNFYGTDSFQYTLADAEPGNPDDTATVTVTVAPVNDAPVAADDAVSTAEDTAIAIDVVMNDTDVEDPFGLVIVAVGTASHGTAAPTGPGEITYTPSPDFCGPSDSFTYTVSDGTDTDDATVTVAPIGCVADAPMASDDAASTAEDTPVTVAVLANDSDADVGDTLHVASVGPAANGVAVIDGANVTYSPALDFCGSDTFDYTASDGALTDTASVTVTIGCGNDAPVAGSDVITTDEDVPAGVNPLSNDSDPDGDTLVLTGVGDPVHGEAQLQPGDSVLYTPDADYCGSDSFGYTVSDGNGGTTLGTVSVTVSCVNDGPQLAPLPDRTTEWGTPVTATASATDPDGPVSYSLLGAPSGASIDPSTGAFSWTPTSAQIGEHLITVRASDGALHDDETFTITVTGRATTLAFGGPSSAQYSDPAMLTATLTDVDGGVAGKTVTFTIGSQQASGVTDASGIATATIVLDGVAGPTSVRVEFAADAAHAAATTIHAFTILKEAIRVSFTGDHLALTSGTASSLALTASLVEPDDGAPGAGPGGAKVDFVELGGAVLCSGIATATGAGQATAMCTAPELALGSRALVLVVSDGRYSSPVDVAAVAVAQTANGSASGGGRAGPTPPDDFAFQVRPVRKSSPTGDVISIHRTATHADVVQSGAISSLSTSCSGGKVKVCSAVIEASSATTRRVDLADGTVTLLSGMSALRIDATDAAEPSDGGVPADTYGVAITGGTSHALSSTAITAGNIRVL